MSIQMTNKKRYWILAFILGLYASLGICTNLENKGVSQLLKRYSSQNFFTLFYANLMVGIKNRTYTSVVFGIVAICMIFMFAMIFAQNYKKREIFVAVVIASFYAVSIWFGIAFQEKDNWNDYISNKYILLKDILFITGWFLLLLAVLLLLTSLVKKYFMNISVTRKNTRKELLTVFLGTAMILLILWLPYIYLFRPGVIHGDTLMEVVQYHRFPINFQNRWITDGVNIIYSNDHPFIHTILFGKILDFGLKIHNLQLAIFIFSTIQVACLILAYAGLITSLYYFGVNKNVLICACLIYGIIPIFPMYALLICGDSSLSLVFICFMINIIWLYQTNGKIIESRWYMLFQMITIFGMAIIKNQGVYIAIVMIVVSMIIYRKYWKRNIIVMILPLLIFYVGYQGMLFKVMHVGNVGRQEALSVVFQQTARCIKYHEDDITKEEEEAISRVLDYDIIGKVYQPDLSDYVKRTFHDDATSQDMKEYFITWFKMGMKYPGEYIQSFVASTWKYYSPLSHDCNIYYTSLNTVQHYCYKRPWTKGVIPKEFTDKMNWGLDKKRIEKRDLAYHYLLLTKYIPIINWFVLPGCVVWIMILCFFIMWIRRNYKMMITFLPVFLVLGVCLLSPVNGNVRYLLPAYCMIPAMIAMALGGKREE